MDDVRAVVERSQALRPMPGTAGEVTVVLTSCGRQDLLERTLDSFFLHNTYPVRDFIIIEDGDGRKNGRLSKKYQDYLLTWRDTGTRVGQVTAIDMAYSHVKTDFIFHCEDDWEFLRPGFIERSLEVLKTDEKILQVSLRDKDDTNGHPVSQRVYFAQWVPYRLLALDYDAGEWGVWHGFAWNPGLRRRRDYELLGSFRSLDPLSTKLPWQVEREASVFYRNHGFVAAILTEDGRPGYIRHLGDNRHVDEADIPHRSRHSARFQITTHVSSEVAAALPAEAGGVQAFQQEASDTPFEDEEAALDAQFLQDVEEPHANLPIDSFEYCVNISLGHRYIYVTTPKCGCSTIQLSLQRLELANPNFDRADFEDLHVRKYSPLLNARQVGSFTQLLNNPSFVKFCFVRHPYSRLLSAYLDKIVRDKGPAKANVLTLLGGSDLNQEVSFEDFINVICEQPVIQMDDHWRVQYYQTMQPKDIL